ncbi:Rpr2-domain-containing protein [Mollisia scopiformis]|uniref:Rpr2-domain-containing protein n=1 Tax=Mollisia scopiformis TaxID=149040 RepID=A0A194XUT8_MOLSC|nr:Rpr2-domain-containing protein [Mollisia scopiformis]KUJ23472.1 Rpr2-domain-containing protein [Mollisia scopiformis]
MAKAKTSKGAVKVPNKAVHSRVSFLFQAASYLATQHSEPSGTKQTAAEASETLEKPAEKVATRPLSRRLASDLRSVTLKAQLRISPQMKRKICKNCDTILIDESTCMNELENKSKGGKKPWADILARKCNTCGVVKRYPLSAQRQKRRHLRTQNGDIAAESAQQNSNTSEERSLK